MFKFIVDTQLPPLLAEFFRHRGFDAKHTSGYPEGIMMSDKKITQYAKNENRIIVTKDSDFMDIVLLSKDKIQVLLIETGNINNKELLLFFKKRMETILSEFQKGSKLVIVQKKNIITY